MTTIGGEEFPAVQIGAGAGPGKRGGRGEDQLLMRDLAVAMPGLVSAMTKEQR
jgi:hypothetical protein